MAAGPLKGEGAVEVLHIWQKCFPSGVLTMTAQENLQGCFECHTLGELF